jgi:hypothetical protein
MTWTKTTGESGSFYQDHMIIKYACETSKIFLEFIPVIKVSLIIEQFMSVLKMKNII